MRTVALSDGQVVYSQTRGDIERYAGVVTYNGGWDFSHLSNIINAEANHPYAHAFEIIGTFGEFYVFFNSINNLVETNAPTGTERFLTMTVGLKEHIYGVYYGGERVGPGDGEGITITPPPPPPPPPPPLPPPPVPNSVTIQPPLDFNLYVGHSRVLGAVVQPSTAPQQVTWVSSNPNVATVSINGEVIAVGSGIAIITALATGTDVSSSVNVTVTLPTPLSVTVVPSAFTLNASNNYTYQLTASVQPIEASQAIIWSSSNTAIATVSPTGVVTGLASGVVTIMATAAGSTVNTTSTGTVTVLPPPPPPLPPPTSVYLIPPTNMNIQIGDSFTIAAGVLPADANQFVIFSSSNLGVANAAQFTTQDGAVGATITGLSVGNSTIIATSPVNGQWASITVTVTAPVVASVALSPPGPITLEVGESQFFTATVSPVNADQTLYYIGSASGRISVTRIGQHGFYVTANTPTEGVQTGLTVVAPTNGISATVNITIPTPPLPPPIINTDFMLTSLMTPPAIAVDEYIAVGYIPSLNAISSLYLTLSIDFTPVGASNLGNRIGAFRVTANTPSAVNLLQQLNSRLIPPSMVQWYHNGSPIPWSDIPVPSNLGNVFASAANNISNLAFSGGAAWNWQIPQALGLGNSLAQVGLVTVVINIPDINDLPRVTEDEGEDDE